MAEYVGFHSETTLRPSTALSAVKLPFSFPINDSMRVLVVPFGADGHGPSYGFEVLNTGANDIHLNFEHAGQTSAYSYFGIDATGASGATAVLWDPRFYVSVTKWAPTYGGPAGIGSNYSPGSGIQTGKGPNANYFRGVYFIPIRGWDFAVGVQVFSGSSPRSSTIPRRVPPLMAPTKTPRRGSSMRSCRACSSIVNWACISPTA